MSEKIIRAYGKEFTIGDIMYNKKEDTVYFILNGGSFGIHKIILVKNDQGTYDMMKSYMGKDGQPAIVKLGKTFPVTRKDGSTAEGLTQGTFALGVKWDKESSREISDNRNALYFTTHKLRDNETVNDNMIKVGWVTGQFGIEIEAASASGSGSSSSEPSFNSPEPAKEVKNEDDVPF